MDAALIPRAYLNVNISKGSLGRVVGTVVPCMVLSFTALVMRIASRRIKSSIQPANFPLRPVRDILAEKLRLYVVLSLEKRTCGEEFASFDDVQEGQGSSRPTYIPVYPMYHVIRRKWRNLLIYVRDHRHQDLEECFPFLIIQQAMSKPCSAG